MATKIISQSGSATMLRTDQLILCHSKVNGWGQSVAAFHSSSYSSSSSLPKTFNDEFVDGLHIYGAYTNPCNG